VGGLGATGLDGDVGRLVLEHAERADLLHVLVWVYAAAAVLAAVSQHASIRQRQKVGTALGALLVIGAVVIVVQTVRVGETGARAVWNPAGGVDYSSDG